MTVSRLELVHKIEEFAGWKSVSRKHRLRTPLRLRSVDRWARRAASKGVRSRPD